MIIYNNYKVIKYNYINGVVNILIIQEITTKKYYIGGDNFGQNKNLFLYDTETGEWKENEFISINISDIDRIIRNNLKQERINKECLKIKQLKLHI